MAGCLFFWCLVGRKEHDTSVRDDPYVWFNTALFHATRQLIPPLLIYLGNMELNTWLLKILDAAGKIGKLLAQCPKNKKEQGV